MEEFKEKIPKHGTAVYICIDCGIQFLSEEQMKQPYAVTAHKGMCYLCKEEKLIVHSRHYNYCIKKEDW